MDGLSSVNDVGILGKGEPSAWVSNHYCQVVYLVIRHDGQRHMHVTPPKEEERKPRRTISTKQLRDIIIIPCSNFKSSFFPKFLQKQFLFDETKTLCRDRMSNYCILPKGISLILFTLGKRMLENI